MNNTDEILELMIKFVQTIIDMDNDKKKSDYRSYYKRKEEEFDPLMRNIKTQLKDIEILFPHLNKPHS
jgi:hypothetical protein